MQFKKRGGRKEIIMSEGLASQSPRTKEPEPLVIAIARARRWLHIMESGRYPTVSALARTLGIDRSYVSRTLRLALLAPYIVQMIVEGTEPSGLSCRRLLNKTPRSWGEQREQLAIKEQ